jgi:hypothetical protein
MSVSSSDQRSAQRKVQNEQIAAETPLSPPDLPPGAKPLPVEEHLRALQRKPQAFLGVVENGLVRLIDPDVRLPERSSVIVVASGKP